MPKDCTTVSKAYIAAKAVIVNSYSHKQVRAVAKHLVSDTYSRGGKKISYLQESSRGFLCTLKRTKDKRGKDKYAQVDTKKFTDNAKKVLVHHLWWRYKNDYQLIDPDQTISHRDADNRVLNLVQESYEMNESRKYCHLFKWYKPLPGEDKARCPHLETPCTGP
jgi:hypothetical protein